MMIRDPKAPNGCIREAVAIAATCGCSGCQRILPMMRFVVTAPDGNGDLTDRCDDCRALAGTAASEGSPANG